MYSITWHTDSTPISAKFNFEFSHSKEPRRSTHPAGLVSLDSHHLLLRLLTIPVDQSMGGGSVRSKMAPILINKTRRSEELGFLIYDNSRIYFYIYYVGLRKNNYFL